MHRHHACQGRLLLPAVILVLILLSVLTCTPAVAAPPETLDLEQLQALIDDAGGTGVPGAMKTTMLGTTPIDIPVKILAITDGFYFGKLIMFEAPDLEDIGGIASGMSGSPIYVDVDDDGVDEDDPMIGAVSYGDIFTLRGTGLATPIEYMTAMKAKHSTAGLKSVTLDEPVKTSSGVVRKLVLGDKKTAQAAAATTSVMQPLALVKITGLPTGSPIYKKLAAKFEKSGIRVLSGPSAAAAGTTPNLEAGSPCGVVFSTGHYALYALGTVTYVDDDDAVLFGHPVLGWDFGVGPVEGILTGATVEAVWPSTYGPYKMMTARDAKGSVTQDRSSGMLAQIGGAAPLMFPITTETTVDGSDPVTDLTNVGQWFATQYYEGGYAASAIAAMGFYHVLDSEGPGSAETTTTIVVSDPQNPEDPPYEITRSNIWDSSSYLGDYAATDVWTILDTLLYDPFGARQVKIESVDVEADFSSARRAAIISDVTIPRAIRAGQNTVNVTYYNYGSAAPQTIQAVLNVPKGTGLTGYLAVMAAGESSSDSFFEEEESFLPTAIAPVTLAESVAQAEELPTNRDIAVVFWPEGEDEEDEPETLETMATGNSAFTGGLEKETADVELLGVSTSNYRGSIIVQGYVRFPGRARNVPVAIYCQEEGKPEPATPKVTVTAKKSGSLALFTAVLSGFRHNVLVTAETPALNADSLPGADQAAGKVRAATQLAFTKRNGKLTLTARVTPTDTTGKVEFQRKVRGRWVAAGTVTLKAGKATRIVPRSGVTAVRARFKGGALNAASAWAQKAVKK